MVDHVVPLGDQTPSRWDSTDSQSILLGVLPYPVGMAVHSLDVFPNLRGHLQECCFSDSFASPFAPINAPCHQELCRRE